MPEEAKVHVGNLPYSIDEDTLRDAFEKYGVVEDVNIITDRDTGRVKGFAFVMFENEDDAKDAIDGLDHTDLEGRQITVNKARARGEGGGGGYRGGGGGRGRGQYSRDRGGDYGGSRNFGGGRGGGGGRNHSGGYSGGRRYNDNSGQQHNRDRYDNDF